LIDTDQISEDEAIMERLGKSEKEKKHYFNDKINN
jgi:hypothetical protein